ncbi:MAG: hypothetical protein PHD51_00495 [Patescibacteria group bacterium]|nr:hypothetical protein [Patescibacteria group bacterium]MDD5490653.1 hypothetical protein [Patescibacteria group bacterium]
METLSQTFFIIKIVAGIIGAIVFILFCYLAYKNIQRYFNRLRFGREGLSHEKIAARWKEIETLAGQMGEMSAKIAVMEADKLLDDVFRMLYLPGSTMGERLKFASYKYPKIKDVWFAHKIRNQLAHESSFHLDHRTADRALKEFRKALEVLGAL